MAVDPYNKPSTKLAKEIAEAWGIDLEIGEGAKESMINNGGFPLMYSSYQALEMLANCTEFS